MTWWIARAKLSQTQNYLFQRCRDDVLKDMLEAASALMQYEYSKHTC